MLFRTRDLERFCMPTRSERSVRRAWKSFDWGAVDRLHDKGYISNPKSAAKSVALSERGAKMAESLFKKHFGIVDQRQ